MCIEYSVGLGGNIGKMGEKPSFMGIFEVWYRYQTVWYRYHIGYGRLVPVLKGWYRYPMFCFELALVF